MRRGAGTRLRLPSRRRRPGHRAGRHRAAGGLRRAVLLRGRALARGQRGARAGQRRALRARARRRLRAAARVRRSRDATHDGNRAGCGVQRGRRAVPRVLVGGRARRRAVQLEAPGRGAVRDGRAVRRRRGVRRRAVRIALIDARRPRRFAFWRRSGDADGDASLKKHETTPKKKKRRDAATRRAPLPARSQTRSLMPLFERANKQTRDDTRRAHSRTTDGRRGRVVSRRSSKSRFSEYYARDTTTRGRASFIFSQKKNAHASYTTYQSRRRRDRDDGILITASSWRWRF